MKHTHKWVGPDVPAGMIPRQNIIVFVGTEMRHDRMLAEKAKKGKYTIDKIPQMN